MLANIMKKTIPLSLASFLLLTTMCKPMYELIPPPLSSELAPGEQENKLHSETIYCGLDSVTEQVKKSTLTNSVGPTFGPHRTSILNRLNRMKEGAIKPMNLSNKVFHMKNCSGKICIAPIRVDHRSN